MGDARDARARARTRCDRPKPSARDGGDVTGAVDASRRARMARGGALEMKRAHPSPHAHARARDRPVITARDARERAPWRSSRRRPRARAAVRWKECPSRSRRRVLSDVKTPASVARTRRSAARARASTGAAARARRRSSSTSVSIDAAMRTCVEAPKIIDAMSRKPTAHARGSRHV